MVNVFASSVQIHASNVYQEFKLSWKGKLINNISTNLSKNIYFFLFKDILWLKKTEFASTRYMEIPIDAFDLRSHLRVCVKVIALLWVHALHTIMIPEMKIFVGCFQAMEVVLQDSNRSMKKDPSLYQSLTWEFTLYQVGFVAEKFR